MWTRGRVDGSMFLSLHFHFLVLERGSLWKKWEFCFVWGFWVLSGMNKKDISYWHEINYFALLCCQRKTKKDHAYIKQACEHTTYHQSSKVNVSWITERCSYIIMFNCCLIKLHWWHQKWWTSTKFKTSCIAYGFHAQHAWSNISYII